MTAAVTFFTANNPITIEGSEREIAEILKQVNESFEVRGGCWLTPEGADDDWVAWVPATTPLATSGVGSEILSDGFPAIAATTIRWTPR